MFFGEFAHQIDDYKRIRIPAKFKPDLGKDYVFAKGAEGTIEVYTKEDIELIAAEYQSAAENDEELEDAFLEFTSGIYTANEDKQGRVTIPDEMLLYAGLSLENKDIVTVGSGKKLVIMSKELRAIKKGKKSYAENLGVLKEKVKENKEKTK